MLDTGDPQEFGKEKMGRQFRKKKKRKKLVTTSPCNSPELELATMLGVELKAWRSTT
jgi:hypothetical protein